jgi:predicted nucleotidyltransferase
VPASLTTLERDCVDRYVATLCDELGDKLEEVWLFGSAARGDMWADFWPMRSDIDLLVVTAEPISHAAQDELAALTYRMYLECGRQISPAFRTRRELRSKWAPLQTEVSRDGVKLWPEDASR